MRFATLKVLNAEEFAISLSNNSPYFLWKDYSARFVTDKLVAKTQTFLDFLKRSQSLLDHLQQNLSLAKELSRFHPKAEDFLLPFRPLGFRDFYCFEEHVKTSRKKRGLEMIPEWYEAPVFYYSNPLSFRGPNETIPYPDGTSEVDFELEFAAVIGREIRNATLKEAKEAIFGYTLLNDWSLRDVWKNFEAKLFMGPAKAKDFATTLGSFILSADELESLRSEKGFDVEVELKWNGESFCRNNWKTIQFSFEEMLVRASQNCTIYPGEVLGSGTLGGGCLFETNLNNEKPRWVKEGDRVEIFWHPDGPTLSNSLGAKECITAAKE